MDEDEKETGLVWERSPDTTISSWFDAVYYAYSINVGGRAGNRKISVE